VTLAVSQLSTVFDLPTGPAAAVDCVSFDIRDGEVLGLVGESGSGKSMIALSLMRLVRPPGRIASGSVRLHGRDLLALSEHEMRHVRGAAMALILQEPMTALDPVLTIGDQIAEALLVHRKVEPREARRHAIELLDRVRMPQASARVDDYPHHLSGGMRQRALIAIAIACGPSLIIADEPTTALDVTIQSQILDLLREMNRTLNLSILFISHDLGVVTEIADQVAVMYAGRIIEHGPVNSVLRNPQHPYTRGLLTCMPDVHAARRIRPIPGSVPALGAFPSGCRFHPRCTERIDPCYTTPPPIERVGPGHCVRCHLYQDAPG
jgi:peptide/nickel transport system ATP-binding protein/oligopeptide transport system ATP-binding protein